MTNPDDVVSWPVLSYPLHASQPEPQPSTQQHSSQSFVTNMSGNQSSKEHDDSWKVIGTANGLAGLLDDLKPFAMHAAEETALIRQNWRCGEMTKEQVMEAIEEVLQNSPEGYKPTLTDYMIRLIDRSLPALPDTEIYHEL